VSYRYRGEYRLTEKGRKVALEILRRHRILEAFLFQLGMEADEACLEASKFDLFIGKKAVQRIYDAVGRPRTCPHGKVIPGVRS